MRELRLRVTEQPDGSVIAHADFTHAENPTEKEECAAHNISRILHDLLLKGALSFGWGKTKAAAEFAHQIHQDIKEAGR